MVFMGLHTPKEVENIKNKYKRIGYKEAEEKYEKEIKSIMDENETIITNHRQRNKKLVNDLKDMNNHLLGLSTDLKAKDKQINILRFFLECECDKEIKRLEAIAKRTRKPRVKKKCENRIIDYKQRKIAFESK